MARVGLVALLALLTALSAVPARAAVMISGQASANISCSAGSCAPTATDAVLNVSDLRSMLAAGNVRILTAGAGVQASDIVVSAYLAWSQPTGLTLDAYRSITMNRRVDVAGVGALTLVHNDGGSGGMIFFGHAGQVRFHALQSQLSIDAAPYVLVRGIAGLAAAIAANPGGNFALATDYDASGDPIYASSPISTTPTGAITGLGNTISSFRLHSLRGGHDYIGLFSESMAKISGLRLRDASISVDGAGQQFAGLVAGAIFFPGGTAPIPVLFNVEVSGVIDAPDVQAGGLVGSLGGMVDHCLADVTVLGSVAGGLVGTNGGHIIASVSLGHVTTSKRPSSYGFAGGIVGNNRYSIDQSYATGLVSGGHAAKVGGLAGDQNGYITNSYSTGDLEVTSGTYAGGLIGLASADTNGDITATSYSTGRLRSGANVFFGGLIGNERDDGTFDNNYWNVTTSGTTDGFYGGSLQGITGLTTSQLTAGLPAGFDPAIWGQSPGINKGYPYLLNNPPR